MIGRPDKNCIFSVTRDSHAEGAGQSDFSLKWCAFQRRARLFTSERRSGIPRQIDLAVSRGKKIANRFSSSRRTFRMGHNRGKHPQKNKGRALCNEGRDATQKATPLRNEQHTLEVAWMIQIH